MPWTYSLPLFGKSFQAYDQAKELERWNRDFEKFTHRKVKYPMMSGRSTDIAYSNVWQSIYSGIGIGSMVGLATRGKGGKTVKRSTRNVYNYYGGR